MIDSSTSLLQQQTHDVIRLAMGSPAHDAIPAALLRQVVGEVLERVGSAAYDYGPTEGEQSLRDALAALLNRDRSTALPDNEFLITSGGMQGLDLTCKLFVEAGDVVAVESPTYTNGLATITSYEGDLLEVPVDRDGMVVEQLAEVVARNRRPPRLIYTIPTFQNPSGTTLSLDRRMLLIDLAAQWGSVILEDDPYRLLRFEGRDVPTIQSLARGRARVVTVGTFSKVIAPGLRVGWVTGEPEIVRRMIDAKQGVDTCTNVPLQLAVAEYLCEGLLDDHLQIVRPCYRSRKYGLQEALSAHLGDMGATWTDPDGGFFLWVSLPGVDTLELFEVALRAGVAFIPGSAFSASAGFRDALRLCFASTGVDRLHEGVRRLRRAIADLCGDTRPHSPKS
jgi:2-aminoadipate transaminase